MARRFFTGEWFEQKDVAPDRDRRSGPDAGVAGDDRDHAGTKKQNGSAVCADLSPIPNPQSPIPKEII